MVRKMSATEARRRFGSLVQTVVEQREPIVVEHRGTPRAVIVSVDEYRRMGGRLEEPEDWRAILQRLDGLIRKEGGPRPMPPIEEVIREMREERDRQLMEAIGFPIEPPERDQQSS